jgi:hypothetical protein
VRLLLRGDGNGPIMVDVWEAMILAPSMRDKSCARRR